MEIPQSEQIILYGTATCGDCRLARLILAKNEIEYSDIDIDENPEFVDLVRQINGGNRSVPTIIFPDGSTMTEPSRHELQAKLDSLSN